MTPKKIFAIVAILYIPFLTYFLFFETASYTAGFPIRDGGDGRDYAILAKNLINHHVFSTDAVAPFSPNSFRTFGYPFFAAAILYIFQTFIAVSVVQIFLTAATAVLIYRMALTMMERRLALVPALLYGLGLNTITLSINLMSEALFIFLLVLSVYVLFFSGHPLSKRRIFLGGLTLGAAIMVRPIGLFLPLFYGLFYIALYHREGIKKILQSAVIFLAGCLMLILPWIVRNGLVTGTWSLTSVGMYDVLFYNVRYFLADREHVSPVVVEERLTKELNIDGAPEDLKNSKRVSEVAFSYLKKYPLQYAVYHVKKEAEVFAQSSLAYFLNEAPRLEGWLSRRHLVEVPGPNLNQLFSRGEYKEIIVAASHQPLLFLDRLFWLLITLLMIVSLILNRRDGFFWHRLFFFALALYLPFLGAPIGDMRYRVPAHPFMFMLAIMGAREVRYRIFHGRI